MSRANGILWKGSRVRRRCQTALLAGALSLSGCLYHPEKQMDEYVAKMMAHPYDVAPAELPPAPKSESAKPAKPQAAETPRDVQTTAFMQMPKEKLHKEMESLRERLKIPEELPGAEASPVTLPREKAAREAAIKKLYPPLPQLPIAPEPMPGPDGCPYTLCSLQELAVANSPTLRQAASDVEAARGALIQANTYPNPTVGISNQPNNANTAPGAVGPVFDQVIKTGGKMKLQKAAAEIDLRNAELALKRARSDLSTAVRNAYFGLLVAKETVRVTRWVAVFTDEIYRLQVDLLETAAAAPYEPAAIRALAFNARLAHVQAIAGYVYAWKTLVATIGLPQLPLSDVAGRIDRLIPCYHYDQVLAYALKHHTDVLTAQKAVDKAMYNLKLAQIAPVCPDVEINTGFAHDFTLPPHGTYVYTTLSFPLAIWDQNKGNIIAAEAALHRASEEAHRVEVSLTNTLATAFTGYKTNLEALAYYRRYILPDQVRAYRGVFERRYVDVNVAFADLLTAQQNLTGSVTNYLTILGGLWSSVVSVADVLQTDDLFQMGHPLEVPELPDMDHLEQLPHWFCHHPCLPPPAPLAAKQAPVQPAAPVLPMPRMLPAAVLPQGTKQ
jgi:cobalt-zinc-cadmium efflux system outer membrane protein